MFSRIYEEVSNQEEQEQRNTDLRATFENVEHFAMLIDNFNKKIRSHIGEEEDAQLPNREIIS